MSDRRRAKELKRKRRQRERQGRVLQASHAAEAPALEEVIEAEFRDPVRLRAHETRLRKLISGGLLDDAIPLEKCLELALAEADAVEPGLPEQERAIQFQSRVLGRLVDLDLAHEVTSALTSAGEDPDSSEDTLALLLGTMLLGVWLNERTPPHENLVWVHALATKLSNALFEGALLAAIVRPTLRVDEDAIAKGFAASLATPVGEKLAALVGLDSQDPSALARDYARLVRDDRFFGPVLRFDSMLHLARAHERFVNENLGRIASFGPTADLRRQALELVEQSFRADITEDAVADLAIDAKRILADPRTGEEESAATRLLVFSLGALEKDRNVYLRRHYVEAFGHRPGLQGHEQPFIHRVLDRPEGTWELEEYEKLLRADGLARHGDRVRRYRESLRHTP
jgi:hypothetical protein